MGLTARTTGNCVLCYTNAGNPVANGGANYNNANANNGLFYVNTNNASNSNANLGSRPLWNTLASNARLVLSALAANIAHRTTLSRLNLGRCRS